MGPWIRWRAPAPAVAPPQGTTRQGTRYGGTNGTSC